MLHTFQGVASLKIMSLITFILVLEIICALIAIVFTKNKLFCIENTFGNQFFMINEGGRRRG